MHRRRLGDTQTEVSAIGLGAMPLSHEGRPDEAQAIATVHAALDAGITLIDTADAYALNAGEVGHNEELVARALRSYGGDTSEVIVATKGGHTREGEDWALNGSPEHMRRAAKESCRRLGVDAIGLYQHHRPDPEVPYEETMGALRELLDEGVIERAGVSNADERQIRVAREIIGDGLVSVQNEFSPSFRSSEDELRLSAGLGLAFLPWSPLGGARSAAGLGDEHDRFAEVARDHGVSPQQVTLAWMLAKSPVVIPIPGSRRPETIRDSAAAADLVLTGDEVAFLDAAHG